MEVNQTTYGNSNIQELFTGHTEKSEEKKDPLGRDAFLTMLVAQLQNQDPLNPMEGTDFTSQLAQFSGLEQQFNMNDNLEAILGALDTKSQDNLLDYIGKTVNGESNTLSITEGKASSGQYTLAGDADVSIAIYDKAGNLMQSIYDGQKAAGIHTVQWDGSTLDGAAAPDGIYTFEILAINEIGGYVDTKTAVSGTVTGVSYEQETPYLQIGEQLLDPSTVTRIVLPPEEKEAAEG